MNPATITCLPSRTDHGLVSSCWENLKQLGIAGIFLGAMAFPLAAAESLPGALRTIHDYRTGQPLQQAVADGTVYEFRATVPHVNFWKTPAPLDGLWIESTDKKTLLWLSSTSGTDATVAGPCVLPTGGGGGSTTNCPPANQTCNGFSYIYPEACCNGSQIYVSGSDCCTPSGVYWNGDPVDTCHVCLNGSVVDTPCATGCGDTLTTNCSPGAITNVLITGVTTNCAGIPMTATVSYGTTSGLRIITSAHHCVNPTTNVLAVTLDHYVWNLSGATKLSGGGTLDASVTFTGACGNGSVSCTVFGKSVNASCSPNTIFRAGNTNFTFTSPPITYDDSPKDSATPWTVAFTLEAVCVSGTNNVSTSFSTSYTSLASINWGIIVNSSGVVTLNKSGDGNPGDINKIVVTSFQDTSSGGYHSAHIVAYFSGCCNGGQLNWVQTITTDTHPPPGETIPWPDALYKPPSQTPYYYGWPPGGTDWISWDFMSSHTTTCP